MSDSIIVIFLHFVKSIAFVKFLNQDLNENQRFQNISSQLSFHVVDISIVKHKHKHLRIVIFVSNYFDDEIRNAKT